MQYSNYGGGADHSDKIMASYAGIYGVQRSPDALSPGPSPPDSRTYGGRREKGFAARGAIRRGPRDPYDVRGLQQSSYQPRQATPASGPRIPIIRSASSGKENDMDDGLMSPRRIGAQVDAFGQMVSGGANWGSALMAAFQGHKMTEEQAAICLQSHWRRHETAVAQVARTLAAEHIQNAWRDQLWLREREAALAYQHALSGSDSRHSLLEDRAATRLNAAWRGHLARVFTAKLREGKKKPTKSVRRSFSFSSKKKRPSVSAAAPAAAPAAADISDGGASTPRRASVTQRVKRSLSFSSKGSSNSGGGGGGGGSAATPASSAATRRTFVLERGHNGLGLELDCTNTVVNIKPGGRAERQGLLMEGDTILTIDGKSCAGVLMQDVMVPGRSVYVTEVSRPERAAAAPAPKQNIIKRSLSFDTKKAAGGVRRSFSFERKR